MLDFARYGRQIALPEIGPDGQRALGSRHVRFTGPGASRAEAIHARCGGVAGTADGLVVRVPVDDDVVAAWAAVEAARRVLGASPGEIPGGLLSYPSP